MFTVLLRNTPYVQRFQNNPGATLLSSGHGQSGETGVEHSGLEPIWSCNECPPKKRSEGIKKRVSDNRAVRPYIHFDVLDSPIQQKSPGSFK